MGYIKDTDGDEFDGLDKCSLLCLLGGLPVTNGISIGICAMDYCGDDPYLTANTPGLIVDDVSRTHICLPIPSFGLLRSYMTS